LIDLNRKNRYLLLGMQPETNLRAAFDKVLNSGHGDGGRAWL
jgi:hypothetical protein